jgi:peptidoglycan/LPS O-acetylase OafA/YrhL
MLGIQVDSKRLFGLDFLRAVAIFIVVHGHGAHFLSNSSLSFITVLPYIHGVDIFFVLSGYLIGKSFLSYAENHNGIVNASKTFHFYIRSALRLLPNYLFILFVYYFLVKFQIINGRTDALPVWRFATFTQNFCTPLVDFYWESWSLSVQWWFYICFPFILFLFTRFVHPKTLVPIICAIMIIVPMVYRAYVSQYAVDDFWYDVWIRKTVLSRTDNIYLGVLAAWAKCYFPKQWERYAWPLFIAGIVLFAVTVLLLKVTGVFYRHIIYLTLLPLPIAFCLPVATCWKSSKTVLGKVVSHISILSYAMFLTNLMVCQIIDVNFATFAQEHAALCYLTYWLIVMIFSYLIYILLEKPFMKIKAKIMDQ